MDQPKELDEPGDEPGTPLPAPGGAPLRPSKSPAAAAHLAKVEAETAQLTAMDWPALRVCLREVVAGTRAVSTEALIRICRQAQEAGDRAKVNLAFEAASKTATPLLLSQAFGQADDERLDQVQEILLQLFAAIRAGKSQLAERFFAHYAKRRSIDQFRLRDARLEAKLERKEPTQTADPIDEVADRSPNLDDRALLSVAVERLPLKLRTAFIQKHHLGMTQKEVAAQNHVDVRTVHQWLKDARAALGQEGEDDDR